MGFPAITILSSFNFLPNLIRHQGYSPCFFSEMASKPLLALLTSMKSSYKMQQNDVSLSCIGRCIAEIIDQEVHPPCGRLLEERV